MKCALCGKETTQACGPKSEFIQKEIDKKMPGAFDTDKMICYDCYDADIEHQIAEEAIRNLRANIQHEMQKSIPGSDMSFLLTYGNKEEFDHISRILCAAYEAEPFQHVTVKIEKVVTLLNQESIVHLDSD